MEVIGLEGVAETLFSTDIGNFAFHLLWYLRSELRLPELGHNFKRKLAISQSGPRCQRHLDQIHLRQIEN